MLRKVLLSLLALAFATQVSAQAYRPGRAPGTRSGYSFLSAVAGGLTPSSVFATVTRTGTGATAPQTVGFSPNLVWSKNRGAAASHALFDTDRGANTYLSTDTQAATTALANSFTSFDASGYTIGSAGLVNTSGNTYVDYAFKAASGFFASGTFVHASGTANTIDLSSLGAVGMVVIKPTTVATTDWTLWHQSLTAGNNLQLNSANAQSTTAAYISVSGTTATIAAGAPAATYEYYAFAHQPSGIIQCGGASTANNTVNVDLGWNAQWVFSKISTTGTTNHSIRDTARGFDTTGGPIIQPNTNGAESAATAVKAISNGISFTNANTLSYVYCAIKAP